MEVDVMRHALTRVGENFSRRAYYRRDANCPACLIYKLAGSSTFAQTRAWISNISEGGALLLVEGFSEVIDDLYVVLPGMRAKIPGKAVRQGEFTVAVEFELTLDSALVERIAAIEPRRRSAAAPRAVRTPAGSARIS